MSTKTLGVACVVLLGIVTLAATGYFRIDALYRDETLGRHHLVCTAVTRVIDGTVTRARQYLLFAASMPLIANAANERNRGQAQDLLHRLTEQTKEAQTPPLSLFDNKGNVLASSVFTTSQAGNAFFQEAVQGRFAFQGPEISKETNEASMLLATPVTHNRKIVGVLAAHLDLQQLAIDVLPILHDAGMEHAFAFALDASGTVLMQTNFSTLAGISMQDEPWAREMLRQGHGRISYNWIDTPRIAVFASLPQTGWTIAVSLREEDILAPQRAIRNSFLGCGLLIALLLLTSLCLLLWKSRFHLRTGSRLALAELASELKDPAGNTPDNEAELLHRALFVALEKMRHGAALLERVISAQNARLHDTLKSMMEGIIRVDENGAILFANPAALHMLRCREQDVLGSRLQSVFRPPVGLGDGSDGLDDVYQAVQMSQHRTYTEKILRRQDESRLLADIVVLPLCKQDGATDGGGILLAFYDVSLVNTQRQMLSAISRAIGATYFVWDEQCRLVDCGDNCTSFLMASNKQEVLENIAQFTPEYQVNGRASASELERHQLHALNTGSSSCDWQFKNTLGIVIPCELILRRFERCGRPAVLGFARDMRLILEATEKLARGHTNLRQVLDALPVAVGVVGKGTLLYANHAMEEFFALHGSEPELTPFSPLQSAPSALNQDFLQKIDNRHLQLFKPDGSMHDYLLSCFPTEFNEMKALMGWLVDVTGLKAENQRLARARDQALETIEINKRFLSRLERDIREPLNGILFTLQHAVQTTSGAEQHQAVNAAYTLGKHLQDSLGYMLHMSEVTPSTLEYEITCFATEDFFHETLHGFAEEAAAKGISFAFRPDPALPETLVGDRTLLRLTIKHLVDNALKYTVEGGVTVDLSQLPSRKTDTVLLHITIADTGLGISDAQLASLFRSFSNGALQTRSENASFGLAMVSDHVRLLKGELCAMSEAGQGTEMHLVLPFALKLPEEALFSETESLPFLHVPDVASVRGKDAAQSKGRILVVDDIATNAQIMILILQKMGYEAVSADSGAHALNLLEKESFDLVFMDIQMPRTSGTEITALIRNDSSGRYPRNIPIVAMTAHAMLGDPEKYLTAGMDDYLSKPVIIEDVANILNNLLRL